MQIMVHEAASLTSDETAALRALSAAVYPPEQVSNWPGRAIEWAPAMWRVIGWDDDGAALVHVGLVLRDAQLNDQVVIVGGIGGVQTDPAARRQGLASRAIARGLAFFAEQGADFALLVCAPDLVPLYEGVGWQLYVGDLRVSQHGERVSFTFNHAMTHAIGPQGPPTGVIDLMGPPW